LIAVKNLRPANGRTWSAPQVDNTAPPQGGFEPKAPDRLAGLNWQYGREADLGDIIVEAY